MAILFIGPLPEPVTGMSLACKVFVDHLRNEFSVDVINLSKRSLGAGIDSVGRVFQVISILWRVWLRCRHAEAIYFTISESVPGNLKDLALYLVCFRNLGRMTIHLHGGAGLRIILEPRHSVLRAMNKFFLKRIGAVVVLGKRHIDIFDGLVSESRLHVVSNFSEEELFIEDSLLRKKFASVTPLRLLFLSNLLQGKGHVELVESYINLSIEFRGRVEIDFAGAFESKQEERNFLASIDGYPCLRYHGSVRGRRKIELFHNAHIFCLPTYYPFEGQPISILEAYASGCAVITTNHSGILDVFSDARNGFLVERRSPASITSVIEQALVSKDDLLRFALFNRREADERYRTKRYNEELALIVSRLRST